MRCGPRARPEERQAGNVPAPRPSALGGNSRVAAGSSRFKNVTLWPVSTGQRGVFTEVVLTAWRARRAQLDQVSESSGHRRRGQGGQHTRGRRSTLVAGARTSAWWQRELQGARASRTGVPEAAADAGPRGRIRVGRRRAAIGWPPAAGGGACLEGAEGVRVLRVALNRPTSLPSLCTAAECIVGSINFCRAASFSGLFCLGKCAWRGLRLWS